MKAELVIREFHDFETHPNRIKRALSSQSPRKSTPWVMT